MRYTHVALILFAALWFPGCSRGDEPVTEFFAIETAKLMKLAPTDAALDTLSGIQLSEASIAHGYYGNGGAMKFVTATFQIYAQFSDSADFPGRGPASIGYHISASTDQTSWLLSAQGNATKQGKQYITENWRRQPVTVILRFIDLKQ